MTELHKGDVVVITKSGATTSGRFYVGEEWVILVRSHPTLHFYKALCPTTGIIVKLCYDSENPHYGREMELKNINYPIY